ncbi:hypothetical protein GCM10020255_105510 [Rhodococcus baikonurensis]
MDVALDVDVAAAGELGILVADRHRGDGVAAHRILGAVDEADEVAVLEVLEAVNLVDDRGRAVQSLRDLPSHLETRVHAHRADVEEQITGSRRRRVNVTLQSGERVQQRRARTGEQSIPSQGTDARHDVQT